VRSTPLRFFRARLRLRKWRCQNHKDMIRTQNLILVEITKITGKDKKTGGDFNSYKHEFLGEGNEIVVGYAPNDAYKKDIVVVTEWNPEKAKPYVWRSKEYQGVTSWKLVDALAASQILRDLKANAK